MAFFPTLPFVNENSEQESYPMRYPIYLYLSGSAFWVSFAEPNKQLPNEMFINQCLLKCMSGNT